MKRFAFQTIRPGVSRKKRGFSAWFGSGGAVPPPRVLSLKKIQRSMRSGPGQLPGGRGLSVWRHGPAPPPSRNRSPPADTQATGAGIRYGFVNAMNIGDVTAKEGSQTSAVYLLGMLFGVSISSLIGNQSMLTIFSSVICMSCFSLFAMNKSLRCVSLPTLNTQVVSAISVNISEASWPA